MNFLTKKTRLSIKKNFFKLLEAGKYDQLLDIAQNEKTIKIVDFFDSEEGFMIFQYFVANFHNSKPMALICEIIPNEILDEFLSLKNFIILKSFLCCEHACENLKTYDEERKVTQIEKFRMLLKIMQNLFPNLCKTTLVL